VKSRSTCVALSLQFFHRAANELLGFANGFHDDLYIHGWLADLARALAIDSMLSDERDRVGEAVEADGKASAHRAHLEFVSLDFVVTVVKNAHLQIVAKKGKPAASSGRLCGTATSYFPAAIFF
jgi:hypothetical protein